MDNTFLELRHISKVYPGVLALNDISVGFKKGEIHSLVGENGAGKSTLIKILSGAIVPDQGEIVLNNEKFLSMNPKSSQKHGIAVIYQEFNLFPSLSIAENIFIGNLMGNKIFIGQAEYEKKTDEIFQRMKIKINPKTLVKNISVAYKQMVEIARAFSKKVKILIMDEPTAPLTTNETEILFDIIHTLKNEGVTIIFITHRLDEVFHISDRVSVMRDGCLVTTMDIINTTKDKLISTMVGRKISDTYPPRQNVIGKPVLEVTNLSCKGMGSLSFTAHEGEIIGFAGLVGSGRTEYMRALFGADEKQSGDIKLHGKIINIKKPAHAVRLGIGFIPEDRKLHGVVMGFPIRWNISLSILHLISDIIFLNRSKEKKITDALISSISIKTTHAMQLTRNLSGGNQQKVVLAKWLAANCEVFIFDEPTRGVDVGARFEIYKLINELCTQGKAIIIISSDMEELIGMSDRIIVICEGQPMGILEKQNFSQETILKYASGYTAGG